MFFELNRIAKENTQLDIHNIPDVAVVSAQLIEECEMKKKEEHRKR